MRLLVALGAIISTALVLPVAAELDRAANTTCKSDKTVLVTVPETTVTVLPSTIHSDDSVGTSKTPHSVISSAETIPVAPYGPETVSTLTSTGGSSEDITTVVIKTRPASTVTRSLKRITTSDGTVVLVTGPKSVVTKTLKSIPVSVHSETSTLRQSSGSGKPLFTTITAVFSQPVSHGSPDSTESFTLVTGTFTLPVYPTVTVVNPPEGSTVTTAPPQSEQTTKPGSFSLSVDLGSDSIFTVSQSIGSGSFAEWTQTVPLTPTLPDIAAPTSGDFTVSFGDSTTSFIVPSHTHQPSPVLEGSSASSTALTSSETVVDKETISLPAPSGQEDSKTYSSRPTASITRWPAYTASPVAPVEPTSRTFTDMTSKHVSSFTMATPPISMPSLPAYSLVDPLPHASDATTTGATKKSARTSVTITYTIPEDEGRPSRVVTLTTDIPVVGGDAPSTFLSSSSVSKVIVTYKIPGGYGLEPSVVTLTTQVPIITRTEGNGDGHASPSTTDKTKTATKSKHSSHIGSSGISSTGLIRTHHSSSSCSSKVPSTSRRTGITHTVTKTFGPWPSPTTCACTNTTRTSTTRSSPLGTDVTGAPNTTSAQGTVTPPFTNSTTFRATASTAPPGSSAGSRLTSAVSFLPTGTSSRITTGSTSFSLTSASLNASSSLPPSSTRRTTSVPAQNTTDAMFTSAVGPPFRPSTTRNVTTGEAPPQTSLAGQPTESSVSQLTQISSFVATTSSDQRSTAPGTSTTSLGGPASLNSTSLFDPTRSSQPTTSGQNTTDQTTTASLTIATSLTSQGNNTTQTVGSLSVSLGDTTQTRPVSRTSTVGTLSTQPVTNSTSPATTQSPTAAISTSRGQSQGGGLTNSTSPTTPSVSAFPSNSANATLGSTGSATASILTQSSPGNSSSASAPLVTSSGSASQTAQASNATEISLVTSSSRSEQTQSGPTTSAPVSFLTASLVGPPLSRNSTLSTSISRNSSVEETSTKASPSTTNTFRNQGQGGRGPSSTSSRTSPSSNSTGILGSPTLSALSTGAASTAAAGSGSGVNSTGVFSSSRIGQTVAGSPPTSSQNSSIVPGVTFSALGSAISVPTILLTPGAGTGGPTTTNATATSSFSASPSQGENEFSTTSGVNATSTSAIGLPAQTQGGSSRWESGTDTVTSSRRDPQSQSAGDGSSALTWPPMTTAVASSTGINATSTAGTASSLNSTATLGDDGSASVTGAPSSQETSGRQQTQSATGGSLESGALTSQSVNFTATSSSAAFVTTRRPDQNTARPDTVNTASPATGTGSPEFCGNEWDRGNYTINFDDRPKIQWPNTTLGLPVFSPYHRFYFSEGFYIVPPPNQTYVPSSPKNMTMWRRLNASTSSVGQIGLGPLRDNECFRFNPLSFDLGCNTTGDYCRFNISALKYDGSLEREVNVSRFSVSFPSCRANNFVNCNLTKVDLSRYNLTDLTSMTFENVGGESDTWFGDDFEFGWTNNTCEAGRCRSGVPNQSRYQRDARSLHKQRALRRQFIRKQQRNKRAPLSQWFQEFIGNGA